MATPSAPLYWVPLERNDPGLRNKSALKSKSTTEHPLQPRTIDSKIIEVKDSSATSATITKASTPTKPSVSFNPLAADTDHGDPLSSGPLGGRPSFDPLSDPLSSSGPSISRNVSDRSLLGDDVPSKPLNLSGYKGKADTRRATIKQRDQEQWDEATRQREKAIALWKTKKAGILQEYTTDELMGVTASFMDESESGRAKSNMDKTQMRLAQLEEADPSTLKNTLQMSQKEFEKRIENYHADLINAWKSEEKVKALKVAIQGAKFLTDTSTIKFYPSKFVLITEILDTFGNLVYERISSRHGPGDKPSDQARETCRNWFHKIASVRELVPRIYIEMAILRCYEFIQHKTFPVVIERICKQIRGIGDPLVAMYARSYLVRKGNEVEPDLKVYIQSAYDDFVDDHRMLNSDKFKSDLSRYHVTYSQYLTLYQPGIDWIFTCYSPSSTQIDFDKILDGYTMTTNHVLLRGIIECLDPSMVAARANRISHYAFKFDENEIVTNLLCLLGECLNNNAPPEDSVQTIIDRVVQFEEKIEDHPMALKLINTFVEFSAKYSTTDSCNTLLGRAHARGKMEFESGKLTAHLQSIVLTAIASIPNVMQLLVMDHFLPLVDLVKGEGEVAIGKSVLTSFSKQSESLKDPIIIGNLFALSVIVHDSMNSLSFFDEIRQNSKIISHFVQMVDFGLDLEKHLNFHVECRKAFANLDIVKQQLINSTLQLCMKALNIVKGKHTKKTASFARACISFCYITIPTMEDALIRLRLYIYSGQIALVNQSLPQADSLFKSAIKLIQEVPTRVTELHNQGQAKSTEPVLTELVEVLLSSLVVVPGHPEAGPFYLIKALLKVIADYGWENTGAKLKIYMKSLGVLSAQFQDKLPYSIQGVDGNDKLYGGDENFKDELQSIINKIVDDILKELSNMSSSETENKADMSRLSLDMFNYLLAFAQLTPKSATLAVKLFEIAKKENKGNYMSTSLRSLKFHTTGLSKDLYNKLSS